MTPDTSPGGPKAAAPPDVRRRARGVRRLARPPVVLAVAIAIAATLWVASGQFGADGKQTDPAAAVTATPAETRPATRVRAMPVHAQMRAREIVVRGRAAASRTVTLKAEIEGRVSEIVKPRGAVVEAGDEIVKLSVDERPAKLREAQALMAQRRMELEAARKLNAQGHRADTQLAQSEALYETARTAVMRMQLDLERATIRAPFAGVVETRAVEVGDFLKVGEPVATVVDLDPALIVGHISERDIGKLAVGGKGRARLIDGHEVEGRIRFISTVADGKTRTYRVELEVPNAEGRVVDGMTAEIYLAGDTTLAHRISPALLTLSDEGAVGVKILDEEDRVVFVPVRMIDATAEAIWLTGLPETIRIITVGQDFVRHGEAVAADEAGAPGEAGAAEAPR